jgi:hypothetical protein
LSQLSSIPLTSTDSGRNLLAQSMVIRIAVELRTVAVRFFELHRRDYMIWVGSVTFQQQLGRRTLAAPVGSPVSRFFSIRHPLSDAGFSQMMIGKLRSHSNP